MRLFRRFFICRFSEEKCQTNKLGCRCGKGSVSAPAPPPAPTPGETAAGVAQAHLDYDPKLAQQSYDILTNPDYGVNPTTAAFNQARRQNFQGESAVQDQLLQNVLAQLQSPTGYTPEQQTALDARRGQAQQELVKSMRNRANLGGGLFGGRAAAAESRDVSNLQNQFASEDIGNQERARLNAFQAALPALQILFPEVGINAPQFQSAAPSGDAAYSGALQARGQDISLAQSNAANAAANRSALYGALGSAVGQIGGAYAGKCWVAAVIFGGWHEPKTVEARHYVSYMAPAWFRDWYTRNGRQIAAFIMDKPILILALRPLFEFFAWQARLGRKGMLCLS